VLLVVTNKTDLACDYLILRLVERGLRFLRLNTEEFGSGYFVDITGGSGGFDFGILLNDGRVINRADIQAVYFRQPVAPAPPADLPPTDSEFASRECREVLRSVWRLVDANKWLNHPRDMWVASNKVEQLRIAREIGFSIPETVVTTSASSIRGFNNAQKRNIVCKAVKHGFLHQGNKVNVASTKRVDQKFLENIEGYASVPMIFQEEIEKEYDVRVTVVGERVFATAIYSQEHAETATDWRLWDVHDIQLRHEAISTPGPIEAACRDITSRFKLRYSAIDLIKCTNGEYYFLEMNPNGQWAWIERMVGYQIRDAIVQELGIG